jgi:hypothetical protein
LAKVRVGSLCQSPSGPRWRARHRSLPRQGVCRLAPCSAWRDPLRAPRARADAPAPRRPRAARDLPRSRVGKGAADAPLRGAGAALLPALRDPRPRLPAPALRRLPARAPGGLLVQAPRLLPLVRGTPHGRHGRAPGGPRPARGSGPPVGTDTPISPPLPLRLRRSAHERGAARLHPGALRGAPSTGRAQVGGTGRPVRCGHLHPTLRFRDEPEPPLPHARARRRLHGQRVRSGAAPLLSSTAPERGGGLPRAGRHGGSDPPADRETCGRRRRRAGARRAAPGPVGRRIPADAHRHGPRGRDAVAPSGPPRGARRARGHGG